MKLIFIIVAVASLALTACNQNRSGAEEAVRAILKDPESARFGDFDFDAKTGRGCLTVNAKNSMGGYTGDQQAYVEKTKDGWQSDGIAEISAESCRSVHIVRAE